ncbi:MAG: hypothetical protein PHV74_08970 [Dehalococcoidia bacterium]|nr:hypothetical protein [Dehalococcoidia bacterium]
MAIIRISIGDRNKDRDELRQALYHLLADDQGPALIERMTDIIRERHVAIWISPKLQRRLLDFAGKQIAEGVTECPEIDAWLLLLWLKADGQMNLPVRWETQPLSDGAGVYGIILQGGANGENVRHHQSQ